MNIIAAIPLILFNIAGLVAIFVIGRAIFKGFAQTMNIKVDPVSTIQNRKINKYAQQLQRAKTTFDSAEYQKSVTHLEKSFYTDPPLISLKFLDSVHDHNFDVLAFVLHVNRSLSGNLTSLPDLERLIQTRMGLLRSLAESYLSLELTKKKRKTEGKETPEWAISEFTKKIKDLESELSDNQGKVTATIATLCAAIIAASKEAQEVSFH